MQYCNRACPRYVLLLCLFLDACGGGVHAPVVTRNGDDRPAPAVSDRRADQPQAAETEPAAVPHLQAPPDYHIVARGDTLYSIAWRYGHDYRDIASWNSIASPYVIYPGQHLRLLPPPRLRSGAVVPAPPREPMPAGPEAAEEKTGVQPPPAPERKPVMAAAPIHWTWPTRGNIITSDSPISKKGIDIDGKVGQKIAAAAAGEVVYSGSGLKGYGRLIIIKHDVTYLSAYAHNSRLMVKEGDWVTEGQQIAEMGQTNDGRTMLHFEIRRNGQPVNPMNYLPAL